MSVVHLWCDFETRSMLDIKKVGLDRYARNAEVLMMAWAVNDQPPQIWLPPAPMPEHVNQLINRPAAVKLAHNVAFERAILTHCLGITSPIEQWIDTAVIARYAGLPGRLALVSEFLGLGDKGKDKDGARLINKFSRPYRGKFRDAADHPEDWQKFQDYCRQDAVAEREIFRRLSKFFTPPPMEQRLWELDAKINERGIPVSMDYVRNAKQVVDAEKKRLAAELRELTGLENANSNKQMLGWLKAEGYEFGSLGKNKVEKALGTV
jgi:DNA polymerase bacteriophage-type